MVVAYWIRKTFSISLTALIYTVFGNNTGTGEGIIEPAVWFCLPFMLISVAAGVAIIFFNRFWRIKSDNSEKFKKLYLAERVVLVFLLALYFFLDLVYIDNKFGVRQFLKTRNEETDFYENYYAFPQNVVIEENEKRNLIYIYLESMESSYSSKEAGGLNDENYIPYLTKLAEENISFSDTEKLGGAKQIAGAGWTIAALFGSETGVPWSFPIEGNSYSNVDFKFASGIYSLGDFLHDQGYTQEFLCGSDIRFAGRDKFFTDHGEYTLFDLYTAREKGYIPNDYYVWWGYEDFTLYKIAQDELIRLASEEKPFNFTMLTVDTHATAGYHCSICPDTFGDNHTANVIACADKQVYDFVEWIKKQDFYENTTIVITGDHLRMDRYCIGNSESDSERRIYNCFINSVHKNDKKVKKTNRNFTILDMFPTVLSSIGYEIGGEQLGFGVNLFSSRSTLPEALTFETLNEELQKQSDFYLKNFAPEFLKDDGDDLAETAYVYKKGKFINE